MTTYPSFIRHVNSDGKVTDKKKDLTMFCRYEIIYLLS